MFTIKGLKGEGKMQNLSVSQMLFRYQIKYKMKYLNKRVFVVLAISSMTFQGCVDKPMIVKLNDTHTVESELIYEDNFDNGLSHWHVEQMPGGKVENNDGKLEITDAKGCTIWSKKSFDGPLMITYDTYVMNEGGPHDRVSDLNCFWMATDPENKDNLFVNSDNRGGKFSNYDSLQLYYVGLGGNDNGTTRFRRYSGTGERPMLPENDLSKAKYMITPNQVAKIKLIAFDGIVQYYRDDELIFNFSDDNPYTSGHFGFRTVDNHMTIDNFKVYQLTATN